MGVFADFLLTFYYLFVMFLCIYFFTHAILASRHVAEPNPNGDYYVEKETFSRHTFVFFTSMSSAHAFAQPQWVQCTIDCVEIFGSEYLWTCADFCIGLFPAP